MKKPEWKLFISDDNHPDFAEGINERYYIDMDNQIVLWRDAITKKMTTAPCWYQTAPWAPWQQINEGNGLEYCITQKHPYHEELQYWAITQLPVYYRYKQSGLESHNGVCYTDSLTYYPFANPDIFEYSFTPFNIK